MQIVENDLVLIFENLISVNLIFFDNFHVHIFKNCALISHNKSKYKIENGLQ